MEICDELITTFTKAGSSEFLNAFVCLLLFRPKHYSVHSNRFRERTRINLLQSNSDCLSLRTSIFVFRCHLFLSKCRSTFPGHSPLIRGLGSTILGLFIAVFKANISKEGTTQSISSCNNRICRLYLIFSYRSF